MAGLFTGVTTDKKKKHEIDPNSFGGANYSDTSVQDKVASISSDDSKLNKMAAATGYQHASRRGLLSSSIAAGAAQREVLKNAIPMALQESQQEHSARAQANQQLHQRNLQSDDFQDRLALLNADLAGQKEMQQTGLDAQEQRLQMEIDANRYNADADRTGAMDRLEAELGSRGEIANLEADTTLATQGMANQNRLDLQGLINEGDLNQTTMQIQQADRQFAAQMATNNEAAYSNWVSQIMNNPDIPADVRQEMLQDAADWRNSNVALVEQLFGFDFTWSTPGQTDSSVGGMEEPQVQQAAEESGADQGADESADDAGTENEGGPEFTNSQMANNNIRFVNGEYQYRPSPRVPYRTISVEEARAIING